MFNWLFGDKKRINELHEETKRSFEAVKKDISGVNQWIKHLHERHTGHDGDISELKVRLSTMEKDMEELKNAFSLADDRVFKQLFKTAVQKKSKQTAVYAVQSGVQTPVQTGVLPNISAFSITERAIVSVLLNSEMKLSYDDLAAMTGKSRATIRGQINGIKQKSEGLLDEIIEGNGKKRVFIPENIKEKMLKNVKVRVKKGKKAGKNTEY